MHAFTQQTKSKIHSAVNDLESRFMTTIKALDGKIVQIRKETDMDAFKLLMNKKADV